MVIFRILRKLLWAVGFDFNHLVTNVRSLGWFFRDYFKLKRQLKSTDDIQMGKPFPFFKDKTDTSGRLSGHYFHQDLLVANKIFEANPKKHVDIGSRTDGFVTHVASFREIEVFDIRETNKEIKNIKFVKADFMEHDPALDGYTDSISSLHVIEHFGLGRYGDSIDKEGHIKGLKNIYKMLRKGGKFYFSAPIGPQRINFNAHRVFSLSYLKSLLLEKYKLDSFSYVDDKGDLHENKDIDSTQAESNFGCSFGCGIFELTKK